MPPLALTRRACSIDLALDVAAPRTARRLADALLPQWGVTEQEVLDCATIVLSELVADALVRSVPGTTMCLGMEVDDVVRLWVADRSPCVPVPQEGPAEPLGRLAVIARVARAWGRQPCQAGGTRTWAELAPAGAA